jgi:hypothetical protein
MRRGRVFALAVAALLAGCGAGLKESRPSGRRPEASVAGRTPLPAVAPELDPENVERRFGFAEARARREESARLAKERRERADLVEKRPGRKASPADPRQLSPGAVGRPEIEAKQACPCAPDGAEDGD